MGEHSRYVPENERQIISRNSVPVRIANHPEGSFHDDHISLGVGGLVEARTIQEPIMREEARLKRLRDELQQKLMDDAYARVRIDHPTATLEYGDFPLTADMMKRILAEDPIRKQLIEAYDAQIADVTKKRYQFEAPFRNELFVGKEGTLVYSLQSGERAADELRKAVVWKKNTSGISTPDPEWTAKIANLRTRMLVSKQVADIHQVEVLPEFQGKGLAKALLDVALWDIEHAKSDVAFSVARVLHDNPDAKKMIGAFQKAGFDAFDCGAVAWDNPRDFTLVVRENPYFKRSEQLSTAK